MIRIATIELTKYARVFVIIILCFVVFQSAFVSRVEAKNLFQFGMFDLDTFRTVNSTFATMIVSAIPFTIVLNICNEFSNGYALKLISNGLSRTSYCTSKIILAGALAIIAMVLYSLIILFFLSIQRATYFDRAIFLSSLIHILIFSLFFSIIAVSVSLLTRTWQSALLVYYGYVIIESFIVLRLEGSAPWVKYLPFNLATSIFELKAIPENFRDYLVPAGIIVPFSFAMVWSSYYFFKKADL